MARVHAFGDDALADLDAVGLVDHLAAGKVSALELVDAAIARCEAVNPQLNGLAFDAYVRARREAKNPGDGFFAGVPTFVKDNVDVAGMPTQEGCDAYVSPAKKRDGDWFTMYAQTGLLPIGKSQMSEFGFSAVAEHPRLGAVRNPWNTDHTAGASSSGSAAFVAAGVVPIAHANDGGGSIRIPAAVNGLVGLKPTRDRFAQDKQTRDMPVRIVSDGVVTRSVRDTAAFLREAEKVSRNLKLPPIGDITRPGPKRLRIAVVTNSVNVAATPEVRDRTLEVARLLEELGHHVTELERPPVPRFFEDDFLLYWGFLSTFLVKSGRIRHRDTWDASKLDNLTRGLSRYAARRLHRLPLAIARLAASGKVSARLFNDYDVVLTPTVTAPTPRVGHLDPTQDFDTIIGRLMEWVAYTPLQNATGDPAVSLPLAVDSTGLPLGVMLGAARGQEATLLEVAYELEEARPFAGLAVRERGPGASPATRPAECAMDDLDEQTVIDAGGWDGRFAVVRAVRTLGDRAAAVIDSNGDGADINLEHFRRVNGAWELSSSGGGAGDWARGWHDGMVAEHDRDEQGWWLTLEPAPDPEAR